MSYPITIVVAPAGFGKTTAVGHILNQHRKTLLVRTPHQASLPQFIREFSRVCAALFPEMGMPPDHMPYHGNEREVLRIYLDWALKHLIDSRVVVAIDDIQNADSDSQVSEFIVKLVDETKLTVKWLLSSRSRSSLPVTRWQAYGDADKIITAEDLRLTLDEAVHLATAFHSPASREQLTLWLDQTNGFAVPLAFAIRLSARRGTTDGILDGTRALTFEYLAEQLWSTLSREDRLLIEVAAFVPLVHIHSLESIDTPNAPARLALLSEEIAFIKVSPEGIFGMHDLFRDFVRQQLLFSGATITRARQISAARAMASSKMYEEAIRLVMEANALDELLELVERYGNRISDSDLVRQIIEICDQCDHLTFGPGMLALQTEYFGWLGDAPRALLFAYALIDRRDAQSAHVLLAIRQHYRVASMQSEQDQLEWLAQSEGLLDRLTPDDRTEVQSYRAAIQAQNRNSHTEAQSLLNQIIGYFSQMPPTGRLSAQIATATAYWWLEKLDLAISYARYAVVTARSVANQSELARALNNLGLMLLSVRDPEVADIFEELREAVERTGSWRFCHVSHWLPAMYFALKGDAELARAGRDLQLGIHPIEEGERTRFTSYRRHSINLGNLLEQRYGLVIKDSGGTWTAEFENDQSYIMFLDVAIAYYLMGNTSAAHQLLRNARSVHKLLNPIQNHAVLESHLIEIVLIGAMGNWHQAKNLLYSISDNAGSLEPIESALKKFCMGPPFVGLESALKLCDGLPFVGLIATITRRVVASIGAAQTDFILSSAELDVLRQLSLGKSNKDIATTRNRSVETVKRQVSGILKKLGADSRTRAIIVAQDRGLL